LSDATSAAHKIVGSAVPHEHYVFARNIQQHGKGLAFEISWQNQLYPVQVPLYGQFNVENILAVVTVMLALGHSLELVVGKLFTLKTVNGRMQRFGDEHSALIFVDYAHTPDALEKALKSARRHCEERLWVVFGCGGDRDTGKRSEMGRCAERYADHVIITDDNPRSENPERIVQDILLGCRFDSSGLPENITVMHDREQAIRTAITKASPGDCIVIAGKGHECYQEFQDKKIPFSDAEVVMRHLQQAGITP
jgi:UDP-N-acetylmuramoyl-L-alanyl-D-glutamate--2,6-diaminopimelate ligase